MTENQPKEIERGIFFHIPKTGGMTLYNIIEDQYKSDEIYKIDPSAIKQSVKGFPSLNNKKNIKFIYGHMNFGIHNKWGVPSKYFAILRDPVSRIVSVYNYAKEQKAHHLHEKIHSDEISLEEFIESTKLIQYNNAFIRSISGKGWEYKFGQVKREAFEKAKKNIEDHFLILGFIDYYDELLVILKKHFNWKPPVYKKINITKNKSEIRDKENTLNGIRQYNQLDIEFYEKYRDKFLNTINALGNDFQNEVKAFKELNSIYCKNYDGKQINKNKGFLKDLDLKYKELMAEGLVEVARYFSEYTTQISG